MSKFSSGKIRKTVRKRNNMTNSKKELAAFYIVSGESKSGTGRKLGVTRQTITIWCKQPEFRALVRRKRREYLDKIYDNSIGNISTAVDVLKNIMKNKDVDPSIQIRAAKELLHYGINSLELRKIRDHSQQIEDERAVQREETELAKKNGKIGYISPASLYR